METAIDTVINLKTETVFMSNLRIDLDKCIGCGKCVRICMMDNLAVEEKKVKETGRGCLKCGHCIATCPKQAISFTDPKDSDMLGRARQEGFMDARPVSEEDLTKIRNRMESSSTLGDLCQTHVLEGKALNRFMDDVWEAVKDKEADTALVKEWAEWRANNHLDPGPALWNGQQVILIFADSPEKAFMASNRMIAEGAFKGVVGFHSNIIMTASRLDEGLVRKHVPHIDRKLYMAYVIGHGRRIIEPGISPFFKKLKGLKDNL